MGVEMTKDEAPMTKEARRSKHECATIQVMASRRAVFPSSFDIRHSTFPRRSCFVLRHSSRAAHFDTAILARV